MKRITTVCLEEWLTFLEGGIEKGKNIQFLYELSKVKKKEKIE